MAKDAKVEKLKERLTVLNDEHRKRPKVLVFDIETAPTLAWMWSQWKANIVATEQDWYILSVAYKWLGEDEIHFVSLPDKKTWKPNSDDDKHVVQVIHKLFNEADAVMAHNGDRFDIRKVQARFLRHGLPPTTSFQSIDTLKLVRKHFALYSNSLKEIARYLGLEYQKLDNDGFALWRDCMAGDPKAWAKMREYNEQDIRVLEAIFYALQPWLHRTTPNPRFNFAHFAPEQANVCPACGTYDTLRLKGVKRTHVNEYPEYVCDKRLGGCGATSQGRHRVPQYGGGVKAK